VPTRRQGGKPEYRSDYLSRRLTGHFLSRVQPQDRLRAGLVTGMLAAAATGGVLTGIGWSERYSVFAAAGRQLVAATGPASPPSDTTATVMGVTLHLAIALFWGMAFATFATRLTGIRLLLAAALSSLAIWAINVWLAASLLRFGNDLTAFPTHAALFYIVLTLALAGGIALARE
jgi:hypothetical protein